MNNIFTPPFFRKYKVNIFVAVLILVSSCSNFTTLNKENSPKSHLDNNPALTTPFLSNLRSIPLWFNTELVVINKDGSITQDDALLVYVSETSHTQGVYEVIKIRKHPSDATETEKLEMTIEPDKVSVKSIVTYTKHDGTPAVSTSIGSLTRSHTKPSPLPVPSKS